MSFFGKVRSAIHYIATLRPILAIFGVKSKTVAAKVADGAAVADSALPPSREASDKEQ